MTPLGMTVLLAVEPVDMRRSFNGLAGWVKSRLGQDAKTEKTMYVFVNRRRDMLKALWRDSTGWCLLAKRLDEREVVLPRDIPEGTSSLAVDSRTLAALLDGAIRRRRETPRDIADEAKAAVQEARMST